jgi:hypothetical protein
MMLPRLPAASRQTAIALVWLVLCTAAASAREFNVQRLSEPQSRVRHPSIGETGLVAWQGFTGVAEAAPITREGSVKPAQGLTRSDIFIWQNGEVRNITGMDTRIVGRSERPSVSGESVVFTAWFDNLAGGGYPFELTRPLKNQEMLQMESEYPTLFDPPQPAPRSALEAEQQGDTPPGAVLPSALPEVADQPDSSLQYQMWRGSGKAGDICLYTLGGSIERITPGTRHFSIPVVSAAGVAFQCARGWPYGYEMLAWKTGATNLTQLTTNYYYVLNPDLHGTELVFQAWDGTDYEIFRYRFDTGETEQITNNQFDDTHPVVWNGEIAWIAHPTVNAEIFHYRDGVIRKISEGSDDNAAPSIWEGRVVWHGYDDTDLEIYYFNGRRTIKLTSNTWDDMSPHIRDGVIAWMSYIDNGDSEIMALDLSDNIAVRLTENDWEDSLPRTAGERIVWQTIDPEGSSIQMAVPKAPRDNPIN